MSLYNDEYVNDVMTCFINGKEVTRDETINSNSYSNVLKSKPHLIKTYNYPYSYDNFGYFKNFTFYL